MDNGFRFCFPFNCITFSGFCCYFSVIFLIWKWENGKWDRNQKTFSAFLFSSFRFYAKRKSEKGKQKRKPKNGKWTKTFSVLRVSFSRSWKINKRNENGQPKTFYVSFFRFPYSVRFVFRKTKTENGRRKKENVFLFQFYSFPFSFSVLPENGKRYLFFCFPSFYFKKREKGKRNVLRFSFSLFPF